jgi:hypothetical protein
MYSKKIGRRILIGGALSLILTAYGIYSCRRSINNNDTAEVARFYSLEEQMNEIEKDCGKDVIKISELITNPDTLEFYLNTQQEYSALKTEKDSLEALPEVKETIENNKRYSTYKNFLSIFSLVPFALIFEGISNQLHWRSEKKKKKSKQE